MIAAGGSMALTKAEPIAPAECHSIVVAHRGGATEAGVPDNSIASLEYAMSLGCYAAECDIYVTSDNKVIVAHADSEGKVNGYYPFNKTLAQIRAAGRLKNGEEIPTLEDYLTHAMKEGSCTRLWLDIKNVTQPEALPGYSTCACEMAIKTIKAMDAQAWVEFICTSNESVMRDCASMAQKAGIPIAWMANRSAVEYKNKGYRWANLNVSDMTDATHSGARSIDEFTEAGIELSVYNVDKVTNMNYYLARIDKMKAVCTNYPKLLTETAGIERIAVDDSDAGEVKYYNLSGIRLKEPTSPGIYVRVAGGKAEKIRL